MKKIFLVLTINLVFSIINAQDTLNKFSNKSITTALGIGFVEAIQSGAGFYYEIGYQQSYWKNKIQSIYTEWRIYIFRNYRRSRCIF